MVSFVFWFLVCLLGLLVGAGLAAFIHFGIMWEIVLLSAAVGLVMKYATNK